MHRTKLLILVGVMIFLTALASAQEEKSQSSARVIANTYRVQYTVSEVADGKRINSRAFETLVQEPVGGQVNWTQIRMGNRVPIPGEKEPHYMDVGINIDTGLQREGGDAGVMVMKTRFELTSVAPEQGSTPGATPILRSVRFNSDHLVITGQKVLISSGDDVNTNHRFEVEALLTRVK